MHALSLDWSHRRGHGLRPIAGTHAVTSLVTCVDVPAPTGQVVEDIRDWHDAFRSAFSFGAMTCPADQLADPAAVAWVRRRRMCVDVTTVEEMNAAIGGGIAPTRIVVHGSELAAAPPLRRGCQLGVGRYVIGSAGQAAVLASAARRRTPTLIDLTDDDGALERPVLGANNLELIGVRMRQTAAAEDADLGQMTMSMIATMADIRRRHGALLTRINLADVNILHAYGRVLSTEAAVIENAVEEACARHRFPRPAVIVSPLAQSRVPAAVSAG